MCCSNGSGSTRSGGHCSYIGLVHLKHHAAGACSSIQLVQRAIVNKQVVVSDPGNSSWMTVKLGCSVVW